MRSLDVNKWNAGDYPGVTSPSLRNHPKSATDSFLGRGNDRWRETRHAARQHGINETNDYFRRELLRVDIETATAVHLQVNQARGQVEVRLLMGQIDARDYTVFHQKREGEPSLRVTACNR
jgi:hypothetical protein